jgi:hypothetical protein
MEFHDVEKLLKFADQQRRKNEYNKEYNKIKYANMKANEQEYKNYLEKIKPIINERSKTNFMKIKENKELYDAYKQKQNERRKKKI